MTTILLVEDNISFRQSLKKNLEDHFPQIIVEEAGEGQEALPKIQCDHPELIFLDIKLPGESGLDHAPENQVNPRRNCGGHADQL